MLALCPHCGIDLHKREDVRVGDLVASVTGDILWKGEAVTLTETEAAIIVALARSAGRFVLVEAIGNIVGSEALDLAAVIRVYVYRLRSKFMALDPDFAMIETRRGSERAGYRWRLT